MKLGRIVAVDAGGARAGRVPSAERVRRGVFRLLRENVLFSIATVTPGGRAYINTAYFAFSSELELFFLSHPDSHHCRNLETNPSIAVTVFPSRQTWGGDDRGLQLFGAGREATGRDARRAERVYAKRFRSYTAWKKGLGPRDRARQYRLYVVKVNRLKLFDEKNFGGAVFVSAFVVRSSRRKEGRL